MLSLKNKKILITGSGSMIGKSTIKALETEETIIDKVLHFETDLLSLSETKKRFEIFKPDYVIHLAGFNGGIKYNELLPSTIFERNTLMAINILACCSMYCIEKAVTVLTSCSYAPSELPLKEEEFLKNEPHPSVLCHALAKRNLFYSGLLHNRQNKLNVVSVIFNNSFGPFDSFDLEKTKVVGALIRKFVEAKKNNLPEVIIWGSGNQKRELLYCDDAGRGLVFALQNYNDNSLPLNIGWGEDFTIRELAETIKELTEYNGALKFDLTRPDGASRKLLDVSKMRLLGFEPIVPIREGLKRTIEWYMEQ